MIYTQNKNFKFENTDEKAVLALVKDKFVIALDFDGVITNPYKLKTDYLRKLSYDITEEQTSPLSCINLGVTPKDHKSATQKAFTTNPKDLPMEKDFKEYFEKICSLKKTAIFIITSRYGSMTQHLEEYLEHNKIKVDGVISTQNKNKLEPLKKINADIFVDDTPFKLWQILREETYPEKIKLVLYRNVQNRLEKNPNPKIIEANNWQELHQIIIDEYGNCLIDKTEVK